MGYGYLAMILVFGIMMNSDYFLSENTHSNNESQEHLELDVLSTQIFIYREYVRNYLDSHPTQEGGVADSALALPNGFIKDGRIKNLFNAGTAYVYCNAECPTGLESALSDKSDGSLMVGRKQNGYFYVKGEANNKIPLSSNIANGDVVYIVK